ncbi:MAG: FAD-binding domain-containing protein [Chloroflexota bacterium]|nr:FAD-binding domain-containing protein [Chloroflexota bacterium]
MCRKPGVQHQQHTISRRRGIDYFHQPLACGDDAVNTGNWQSVAGSSNDPQPSFRICNPVTQGETYDPDGTCVRRYVPELANVPPKYYRIWAATTQVMIVNTSGSVNVIRAWQDRS